MESNVTLPRGVTIIPYRKGRFAISKRLSPSDRCPGLWQFPGGMVEPGEDTLQAARRELHEETGIDVLGHRFIFIAKSAPMVGYKGEVYSGYRYGVVLLKDEHPLNTEPDKHTLWEWVSAEELRNRVMLFGIVHYAFEFQRLLDSINDQS